MSCLSDPQQWGERGWFDTRTVTCLSKFEISKPFIHRRRFSSRATLYHNRMLSAHLGIVPDVRCTITVQRVYFKHMHIPRRTYGQLHCSCTQRRNLLHFHRLHLLMFKHDSLLTRTTCTVPANHHAPTSLADTNSWLSFLFRWRFQSWP